MLNLDVIRLKLGSTTQELWSDPKHNPVDECWAEKFPADAEFIGLAHDLYIPALIAEVERLRAMLTGGENRKEPKYYDKPEVIAELPNGTLYDAGPDLVRFVPHSTDKKGQPPSPADST